MKRWFLPLAQLVVGLAMIPQAFLFGVFGILLLLEMLRQGVGSELPASQQLYGWAMLATSFSVDAAAVLCLIGAAFLMYKPSQRGVRFSVAGTACYWLYIVAHLVMIWSLSGGLGDITLLDAVDYPIGVVAAAVAVALFFSSPDKMRAGT
jgi:hypothetical protein